MLLLQSFISFATVLSLVFRNGSLAQIGLCFARQQRTIGGNGIAFKDDDLVIALVQQRCGQVQRLLRAGGIVIAADVEAVYHDKAFFQPLREERALQLAPSPLGLRREDRFLYLGAPELAVQVDDLVEVDGQAYLVQSAHPIYAGKSVCHQWAVLRPRDKEET